MKKQSVLFILLFSVMTVFSSYAEEYNDTTSDLLSVYNKTTRIPNREEMLEFNRKLNEYNNLLTQQQQIDKFNASIEEADAYRIELLKSAQQQVDSLITQSTQCADYISLNIYSDDITTLITKDSEYKILQRAANDILQQTNSYSVPMRASSLNVDWEGRAQEIVEYEREITTARQLTIGEFVLGDVYTCSSPLGKEFTIASNWGSRIDPITKTSVQYHSGVDLECQTGTNVYSIFNGTVLEAGDNWAMGNYVRIKHGDGVISLYAHLDQPLVSTGQEVKQYDLIGKSGATGQRVSGPHLHFALFINGQSVDPGILLNHK